MPLDAAPAAVGYLAFGECRQEAGFVITCATEQ
jgi:hypothetical protein